MAKIPIISYMLETIALFILVGVFEYHFDYSGAESFISDSALALFVLPYYSRKIRKYHFAQYLDMLKQDSD
jgi:hypothetical protein